MKKARKPAKAAKAGKALKPAPPPATAAETAFRRAAAIRGDAVPLKEGQLPPGATHELEGYDKAGTPIIKRKRFSMS